MIRRERGGVGFERGLIWFGTEVRRRNSSAWVRKYQGRLLQAPAGHPMPIDQVKENYWKRTQSMRDWVFFGPRSTFYLRGTRQAPGGRYWWHYNGVVWVTEDGSLNSADVKLLLDDRTKRDRRRLGKEPGGQRSVRPVPAIEQIRQLGELREKGLITADEFEAKKAELLRRI